MELRASRVQVLPAATKAHSCFLMGQVASRARSLQAVTSYLLQPPAGASPGCATVTAAEVWVVEATATVGALRGEETSRASQGWAGIRAGAGRHLVPAGLPVNHTPEAARLQAPRDTYACCGVVKVLAAEMALAVPPASRAVTFTL